MKKEVLNIVIFLKTLTPPVTHEYLFILDVKKEIKCYVDSSKYFTSYILIQDQFIVTEYFQLIRKFKNSNNTIYLELLGFYRLLLKISNLESFYGPFTKLSIFIDNQVITFLGQDMFTQPIRSNYKGVIQLYEKCKLITSTLKTKLTINHIMGIKNPADRYSRTYIKNYKELLNLC